MTPKSVTIDVTILVINTSAAFGFKSLIDSAALELYSAVLDKETFI